MLYVFSSTILPFFIVYVVGAVPEANEAANLLTVSILVASNIVLKYSEVTVVALKLNALPPLNDATGSPETA